MNKVYQVYQLWEGALFPLRGYDSLVWLGRFLDKQKEAGHEVYVRRVITDHQTDWYQRTPESASGLGYLCKEQQARIDVAPVLKEVTV